MIINKILDVLLDKYDIEEEDVDKVKKILDKVSFTKRDGKNVMVIEIGEGIELTIVQKRYNMSFKGLGGEVIWLCPSLDDSSNDLSGNGNNGTYVNGTSTVSNTEFGGSRAYLFDGTDQGISFAYIASMNLVTSVSYVFWFKKSSASFSNYILNKGGSNKRSPWINTLWKW